MTSEISTPHAPRAVGPYAQGRVAGGVLYASGQLPIDPATGALIEGLPGELTRRCLANLDAVAQAAGTRLSQALKVTVYLTDLRDAPEVNAAYAAYFTAPYPARTSVQVAGLPMGARLEIDAVVAL
jgi:reactive intermediate/imine deaminase